MIDSLALGIYGTLAPNKRSRDFLEQEERPDCYSVFHSLATVLGLDAGGGRGLWGMNDADGPYFSNDDDRSTLLGWFQVSPLAQVDTSLPIESLTTCATSTLERFGPLHATGFEAYLPIHEKATDEWSMFGARSWLDMCDPGDRLEVAASIELPDSVDGARSLEQLDVAINLFEQYHSGVRLVHTTRPAPAALGEPAVPWRWWVTENGSFSHSFHLSLPDWSPISVGWAVGCVAKGLQRGGVNAGVGLRISLVPT